MATVPAHLRADQCRLDDLVAARSQHVALHDFPHAADVVDDVVVFHGATLREAAAEPARYNEVLVETNICSHTTRFFFIAFPGSEIPLAS